MVLQCVDITGNNMGRRAFMSSDIIVAREVYTAVRRILSSSQKQANITDFLKHQLCKAKEGNLSCLSGCINQNILDY